MKRKLIIAMLAFLISVPAIAQKSKVTSAWMYLKHQELDKALDAINTAIESDETKNDPKTWLYRGNIYSAISTSPKFQNLDTNASEKAIESYSKTIKLDTKGKYNEAVDSLNNIANRSYNAAAQAFPKKEYIKAYNEFTRVLEINDVLGDKNKALQFMLASVNLKPEDLRLFQATAAQMAEKEDEAKKIYQKLANDGYDDATVYLNLADMYKKAGDTANALTVLDKGVNSVKDKKSILIEKLNTYIQMGHSEKAVSLGAEAIAADPTNASIYIAMGNIYDYKLNKPVEAQEMYNKAISLDPNNFNVNYSLGASFFNQGAAVYNQSLNEKDYVKAGKLENQAKEIWKKAIPYLEKSHDLKPKDNEVLNTLAQIYAQLGDIEKSKKYREMIQK